MTWYNPIRRAVGDVVDASDWNEAMYYDLRYLKGMDGSVTIESDAIIGGVGINAHHNATTGVHGLSGNNHFAMADGSQYVAVNRAGDNKLGQDYKRDGTTGILRIHGGDEDYPSRIELYGGSYVGDLAGAIRLIVQNGDNTGQVEAIRISKGDNPAISGYARIQMQMIKTSTSSASNSGVGTHNIQMHDYCFFPSIWCNQDTYAAYVDQYYAGSDPGDTIGRFRVYLTGTNPVSVVRWRYCTASGPPEIWIGFDNEENIVSVWESEDPAPLSPPISSENIKMLARINPDEETLAYIRSLAPDIGRRLIKDGRIYGNKLFVDSLPNLPSLELTIKPVDEFPRIRRVERTRKVEKETLIAATRSQRTFNKETGLWESRDVPFVLPTNVKRYRLVNPEMGEESEIEEYVREEIQAVYKKGVEIIDERYIEEVPLKEAS